MSSNLQKRLEKVEELMSPPPVQKFRIEIVYINPDRTVAGRRIIGPGVNEVIEDDDE